MGGHEEALSSTTVNMRASGNSSGSASSGASDIGSSSSGGGSSGGMEASLQLDSGSSGSSSGGGSSRIASSSAGSGIGSGIGSSSDGSGGSSPSIAIASSSRSNSDGGTRKLNSSRSGERALHRRLSDGVREIWFELGYDGRPGAISAQELADGLARLGLPASELVVNEILAGADANEDGKLDYAELVGYVRKREQEIEASYSRLTPRHTLARVPTDEIAFADLKDSLASLGVQPTDREIAVFLAQVRGPTWALARR